MGNARGKRRPRRLRRLFVLSSLVGAVLAWRERQMARNSAR